MACCLSLFSCIQDVNRVVELLSESASENVKGLNETEEESSTVEAGWDVDPEQWGWSEDANEPESKTNLNSSWLQDCCISLSPSNDTLVIAKNDKAVFLASKWDKSADDPKNKYEVMWSGSLAVEDGECVNDILCIPLASQHKSSQGCPDWTCIIAGMTSGYMRIYLQNGSLMFSQLLHEDYVVRLKCRTWQPYRSFGKVEQVEELAILYPSALVIIDGFSLFQSLRACRNQLAKAQASGMQDLIQPPPLAYKKWRFDGQKHITDIASCGVVTQNMFDQLQTASFIGGYNAVIRTSAPAMSHYVASGADPFLAVYCAIEGSGPPLISDVAMAVASKLTSAVLSRLSAASGWLGWGSKPAAQPAEQTKLPKPKVEKGAKLAARFGLPDFPRRGTNITLAPNGKVAVTTDEFGRVMLLDVKKGIAIRMWKGYREAECGWIMVDEDDFTSHEPSTNEQHRTALFLVIYAAKRGILEIWRAEQGPRVAAFNIGKDCRLLYAGHGIMGLGHVIRQGLAPPQHTLNCTLIQGDGRLKVISVPFHYALSDKHSRRVRDLHLLKKLTVIMDSIKSTDGDVNQVMEQLEVPLLDIFVDMRTPQLLRQGLQCLLGTVGCPCSLMLKAVDSVSQAVDNNGLKSAEEEEVGPDETENLRRFCLVQKRLLQTHASIRALVDLENAEKPVVGKNKELALAQLLGITKSETMEILELLNVYWRNIPQTTAGSTGSTLTVTTFLSCFEPAADKSSKPDSDVPGPSGSETSGSQGVIVRKGISADMSLHLARFLFEGCLLGACSPESLNLPLDSSRIQPAHLMDLLVCLWLDSPDHRLDTVDTLFSLHSIVSIISSITGGVFCEEIKAVDNSVSPWWQRVRSTLQQSVSVARALALAAVCRSVSLGMNTAAIKVQGAEVEKESSDLAAADWVSISVEMECWNLLLCQLSDLVMLKTYLARLPSIVGQEPTSHLVSNDLSVQGLLNGGHGGASRILARTLVWYGVSPQLLGHQKRMGPSSIETQEGEEGEEEVEEDDRPEEEVEVEEQGMEELEGLRDIRARFPHSLHQDILWASCVQECALQWSADKEQTDKLVSALDHLRHIHCIGLQHGLAFLLWKTYFKDKISSVVVLMEKVGKAPKDRLCRKTVEMSCEALEQFLFVVKKLLELLAQIDMSEAEVLVLKMEDFWTRNSSAPLSMLEEALDQPTSYVPLVRLHITLVSVMWLIMGLELKSVRPLTLFDSTTKGAFLKDLSSNPPIPSGATDETILQSRKKFLYKAMSMLTSAQASQQMTGTSPAHPESTDWLKVVLALADQLEVDVDPLRCHYVQELYSAGLDSAGKEVLMSVNDKQGLAGKLLVIVGQRLAHTLDSSESTTSVTQLSRLSTHISRWIKQQSPIKLACRDVPIQRTAELLSTILPLLPSGSNNCTLATELSEATQSLYR